MAKKKDDSVRPGTKKCKTCGVDTVTRKYLGDNVVLDAKPVGGYLFIEDEYGEEIGIEEVPIIHLPHACKAKGKPAKGGSKKSEKKTDKKETPKTGDGIDPLAEDDDRSEKLIFADGGELELTPAVRRANPDAYLEHCLQAVEREIIE